MADLGTLFPSAGLYDARMIDNAVIVDKWSPRTTQGVIAPRIISKSPAVSAFMRAIAAVNNTRRYVEPQPVIAAADLSPVMR